MINNGTLFFLEVGNGNTLSNMIKRMQFKENIRTASLSSIKQIEMFMEENNEN